MSQITSRILVRVTSPQVWERFKGEYYEELGGDFLDCIDMNFREFSIESDWSCWPDDLGLLVNWIAEILGKDGIIIADSDNINTDPMNFYAYYFGEKVHSGYLENKFYSGEMEEFDYYFDVCEIYDIAKWLNYGKYSLKKTEKNQLLRFGVQYREGRYTSFMFENLNLPEQIRLSQTDSSECADCVEKTTVGELATLLDATEPGGKPRIKVVGKAGVLGYLPYNLSENLMPALFMENPNINATVTEVVCRPRRKKNPKGPYLSIHIEINNGIQTSSEKSLDETQYCYCYVGFSDWAGWYFSDFDVEVGELVIAPFGRYQKEKAGIINEIRFGTLEEAPFSPDKLKYLKRKFGMLEPTELQDEKYQIWEEICKHTDYQKLTYNLKEMCESGRYALSGPILYRILESEALPCCWAENPSVQHIGQVIVPAIVSGKPVLRFPGNLHIPNWAVELKMDYLILSEGIRYLESDNYLFYTTKKVFLPASIETIASNVFSDSRGEYKDLYLHDDLVFYTPVGCYADRFLKAYKPREKSWTNSILLVVNRDGPNSFLDRVNLSAFLFQLDDHGLIARLQDKEWPEEEQTDTLKIPSEVSGYPVKSLQLHSVPSFIKKLVIPDSIEFFCDLNPLDAVELVEIDDRNPFFCTDGISLFTKDKKTLLHFVSGSINRYSIPDGTVYINDSAFKYATNLMELTIPDSVIKIGDKAFVSSGIQEIYGLDHVSMIGKDVFYDAHFTIPFISKKSNTKILAGSNLVKFHDFHSTVLKLPDGITRICKYALAGPDENDQVEEIIIPDTVRIIEEYAFCGREKLKRIHIPEGVCEIKSNVFKDCFSLTKLSIPSTVTFLDPSAFPRKRSHKSCQDIVECTLRTLEVSRKNSYYQMLDGMLLTKDGTTLLFVLNSTKIKKLIIPEGVRHIQANFVSYNANLVEISFPDSVTDIGDYAFAYCSSLRSVHFSKNLRSIGNHAFEGTSLNEIILPDGIEALGKEAFAGNQVEHVLLPASVKTIGWGVFSGSFVKEIEIFDAIEPDAMDAAEGYEDSNTFMDHPNTMIGYLGIGRSGSVFRSFIWTNYTITVRSSETGDIKYKVWMGGKSSSISRYTTLLICGWGSHASFYFKKLDEIFPSIDKYEGKLETAMYRLAYPVDLSEEHRKMYQDYIKLTQGKT